VFYDDIAKYTRATNDTLNSIESILNAPYFSAWLIGFIEAESCFSIYLATLQKEDYLVASFEITQTNGEILIRAIRKYLSLTPKIYKDNTNNFKLKVSTKCVRSIENVIRFINKAPCFARKLFGYKKLQYLLWIKKLRTMSRYAKKINIPNKY